MKKKFFYRIYTFLYNDFLIDNNSPKLNQSTESQINYEDINMMKISKEIKKAFDIAKKVIYMKTLFFRSEISF